MKDPKHLKNGEKIIFGLGDFYGGGAQALIGVLYFYFLTQIIGINAFWAGTIVLVSKIWDAVTDPLMGVISDNTRTRFGRRRPYIFLGGILLVGTFALLWAPIGSWASDSWKIAFAMITYIWYSTVSTIINVPYSSMSAEIAIEEKERNSANVIRLIFSTVATAIGTLVPSIILGFLKDGTITLTTFYLIISIGFGLLFTVPLLLIGFFTRERVEFSKKKEKFDIKNFVRPMKVKGFRQLVGMYVSQSISMDILSNGIMLYAIYCFSPSASSTIFLGIFIAIQLLMFPIINVLVNKIDKNKIYYFGIPLALVGILGVTLYPSNWPIIGAYAATAVLAIGFAGAQLTSWLIFPDAVDAGELTFGTRNTGSFSGIMTFCRKMSSAIAIWLFGLVLSLTGYVKSEDTQPESAKWGIRIVMLVGFFLLMTAGYFIARKFVLTHENTKKTRKFLELQREGKLAEISPEDKIEYDDLLKKIV